MENVITNPIVQKFEFKLKRIQWEKQRWYLIVDIACLDHDLAMRYAMSFMPRTDGYQRRMKDLEDKIIAIQNDVQETLLVEEKEAQIADLSEKVAQVGREMEQFLATNPPIQTMASLIELKRKGEVDRVTFLISDKIIPELNEKSFMLDHQYELVLEDPEMFEIAKSANKLIVKMSS